MTTGKTIIGASTSYNNLLENFVLTFSKELISCELYQNNEYIKKYEKQV